MHTNKNDYLFKRVEELENENKRLKERLNYYEGEHVIARQLWQRDDVAIQLEGLGFPPSEENIDIVIHEGRVDDVLSDCSDGNGIIIYCINSVEDKLERLKGE